MTPTFLLLAAMFGGAIGALCALMTTALLAIYFEL